MGKTVASTLGRLVRLSEWIYERHADRCGLCCVLGGEFCRTGLHLQQLTEALEP
jgi:hypothetical protein